MECDVLIRRRAPGEAAWKGRGRPENSHCIMVLYTDHFSEPEIPKNKLLIALLAKKKTEKEEEEERTKARASVEEIRGERIL